MPDIATCLRKGARGSHLAPHTSVPARRQARLGQGTSWSLARVTKASLPFCLLEGALVVLPRRGSSYTRSRLPAPPALWLA